MGEVSEKIESWPIENVIPYSNNAKIHDPVQISKIAEAIRVYGWDQPIVVDEKGVIIKGHGRRLAAIELGMKFVPVIIRTDLDAKKVKAARLADNRVAQGDVDAELLQSEILKLANAEVDLSAMGFDDKELDFLTSNLDEMDEDSIIDNLNDEVERNTEDSQKSVESADAVAIPLHEAFGFKSVTTEQARTIINFMSNLEEESETAGADALIDFMKKLLP